MSSNWRTMVERLHVTHLAGAVRDRRRTVTKMAGAGKSQASTSPPGPRLVENEVLYLALKAQTRNHWQRFEENRSKGIDVMAQRAAPADFSMITASCHLGFRPASQSKVDDLNVACNVHLDDFCRRAGDLVCCQTSYKTWAGHVPYLLVHNLAILSKSDGEGKHALQQDGSLGRCGKKPKTKLDRRQRSGTKLAGLLFNATHTKRVQEASCVEPRIARSGCRRKKKDLARKKLSLNVPFESLLSQRSTWSKLSHNNLPIYSHWRFHTEGHSLSSLPSQGFCRDIILPKRR